jgi:hypothetical protein
VNSGYYPCDEYLEGWNSNNDWSANHSHTRVRSSAYQNL